MIRILIVFFVIVVLVVVFVFVLVIIIVVHVGYLIDFASRVPAECVTLIEKEHSVRIRKLYSGKNHLLALDDRGFLYVLGDNSKNQLGIPDSDRITRLVSHPHLFNYPVSVNANKSSTVVIDKYDELLAFGDNSLGQLGISAVHSVPVPMPLDEWVTVRPMNNSLVN